MPLNLSTYSVCVVFRWKLHPTYINFIWEEIFKLFVSVLFFFLRNIKTNLIWIGIAYISQITVFDFRICNLLSRINTIVYTSSKILYQNCGSYKYFESFMNKITIFFY